MIFLFPIIGLIALSCEKEPISQESPGISEIPGRSLLNNGSWGTWTDSEACQNSGEILICCPDPAADCSRMEVTVSPGLITPVLNVADNDSIDVKNFFANEDWQTYFPQLSGESDILDDISNGVYVWNKNEYGNFVWVEFISSGSQIEFVLPIEVK